MGANCQPCSSCRTAEGAKRHRSQGGKERGWGGGFGGGLPPVLPKARSAVGRRGAMLGSPLPAVKGDRSGTVIGCSPLWEMGRGASYSGVARNLLRGQELGCKRSAAQQPPDGRRREAP